MSSRKRKQGRMFLPCSARLSCSLLLLVGVKNRLHNCCVFGVPPTQKRANFPPGNALLIGLNDFVPLLFGNAWEQGIRLLCFLIRWERSRCCSCDLECSCLFLRNSGLGE